MLAASQSTSSGNVLILILAVAEGSPDEMHLCPVILREDYKVPSGCIFKVYVLESIDSIYFRNGILKMSFISFSFVDVIFPILDDKLNI